MAGIVRKIVKITTAPAAIGPYSQAVIAGNTMYLSGQIGLIPGTKNMIEGGIVAETEQALKNMGEVLKSQGLTYNNVVKTTVLMADLEDFQKMNAVYSRFFPKNPPARAAYQVARLPLDGQVEIEAIAVIGHIVDDMSHL
ncbi:2-iminobutanoate/2-iminopropanoate deaminase isoform X1 [Strongylocentrotus purpuratus]|uniref:2-iminobutanoate/2-iminopropanoate deaminase n=1 Tax=Strongylocentrotus purpuratus TaxID=7668 RepID=A0A7M7GIJ3_STRPU|nr:2-iminobutanoate/2-iminopropanoate deaminase isoform X1 [Strongylocentrotus purpuratus]|eukprot:XP_003729764.1 PREDICTED: ribonuclease UK114 isoform X1 [Strongylocentrotus purpuratus]